MNIFLRLAIVFGMAALAALGAGCRENDSNAQAPATDVGAGDTAVRAAGAQSNSPRNNNDASPQNIKPYSDNSGTKHRGAASPPPFDIDPEDPPAGSEVTIDVDIEGATGIAFSAEGPGCGTIAATALGKNPLSIAGLAADRGYCDMKASATGGVVQSYGGRFEVDATDPEIPPLALVDGYWDEEKLPAADAVPPVITAIAGPAIPHGGSTRVWPFCDG